MTQILKPLADVTAGSWTPNGAATLADCLNDGSDATYIQSTGTQAFCEVTIDPGQFTWTNTDHVLKFRMRTAGTSTAESCSMQLYQGTRLLYNFSAQTNRSGSFVEKSVSIDGNVITNYSDLRLRFVPVHAVTETIDISQAWFEAADTDIPAGTVYVFPDPNVEVTSVDGVASRANTQESWANLRTSAGSTRNDTGVQNRAAGLRTQTTSGLWFEMNRGVYLFDTNGVIPGGETILSAEVRLHGQGATFTNGTWTDLEAVLCATSPASNTALVNADYNIANWGSTDFANRILFTDWGVGADNIFTLNAAGLAAIDTSGITKFGVRSSADIDDTEPAWASGRINGVNAFNAEQFEKSKIPYLKIVYGSATTTKFVPWICGDSYG